MTSGCDFDLRLPMKDLTDHEPTGGAKMKLSHEDERRHHSRTRQSWTAAVGFEDDRDLVPATTRDVSVGGACVRSSLPAAPGDSLVVVLSMKDRAVPALATVVQTEAAPDGRRVLHLRFGWLSEASHDKLAAVTHDIGSDPPSD
jgi:hypothetical protein